MKLVAFSYTEVVIVYFAQISGLFLLDTPSIAIRGWGWINSLKISDSFYEAMKLIKEGAKTYKPGRSGKSHGNMKLHHGWSSTNSIRSCLVQTAAEFTPSLAALGLCYNQTQENRARGAGMSPSADTLLFHCSLQCLTYFRNSSRNDRLRKISIRMIPFAKSGLLVGDVTV